MAATLAGALTHLMALGTRDRRKEIDNEAGEREMSCTTLSHSAIYRHGSFALEAKSQYTLYGPRELSVT